MKYMCFIERGKMRSKDRILPRSYFFDKKNPLKDSGFFY